MPGRRSISCMKAAPSMASRTAAVASRSSELTFMLWASVTKRSMLASASSTPAGLSRPVASRATRQTAQTFSLNTGNRRPARPLVDHETDRVRPDVDDPTRRVISACASSAKVCTSGSPSMWAPSSRNRIGLQRQFGRGPTPPLLQEQVSGAENQSRYRAAQAARRCLDPTARGLS